MTRFSARYALALALLLAATVAAVAVGRNQPRRDECGGHERLLDLAAFGPEATRIEEGPRSTRIEAGRLTGSLPNPHSASDPLLFTVDRTWGLANRVLQPAYALPISGEPDEVAHGLREAGDTLLPIQHSYERQSHVVRVIASIRVHRGEPIHSAFWTRVRGGPAALLHGSYPLTLFAISGVVRPTQVKVLEEQLDAWLVEAWLHYARVCGGAGSPASTSVSVPR